MRLSREGIRSNLLSFYNWKVLVKQQMRRKRWICWSNSNFWWAILFTNKRLTLSWNESKSRRKQSRKGMSRTWLRRTRTLTNAGKVTRKKGNRLSKKLMIFKLKRQRYDEVNRRWRNDDSWNLRWSNGNYSENINRWNKMKSKNEFRCKKILERFKSCMNSSLLFNDFILF